MDQTAHALSYAYEPLDPSFNEIRLVEILPHGDNINSLIRLRLRHISLPDKSHTATPRTSNTKLELVKSLPEDWKLRVCLNGSFLSKHVKDYGPAESYKIMWNHSDTGQDPNESRTAPKRSKINLEYEGLSYVWAPSGNEETGEVIDNESCKNLGRILMRQNLAAALRHLRQADVPRLM